MRKAYAVSNDGLKALMFEGKRLRDFFVDRVSGFAPCPVSVYRRVESIERGAEADGLPCRFVALDMSVPEFWDYDGWNVVYDKAVAVGLL